MGGCDVDEGVCRIVVGRPVRRRDSGARVVFVESVFAGIDGLVPGSVGLVLDTLGLESLICRPVFCWGGMGYRLGTASEPLHSTNYKI